MEDARSNPGLPHVILPPFWPTARVRHFSQEAVMTSQSTSGDTISRSITVESRVQMLDHMKKQADSRGFTIMCDEREPMGGNTAPSAPGLLRLLHPVLRDDPA